MVENRILKENARAQLDNNIFKEKWLTMLVVCAIPTLILNLISNIFGEFNVFNLTAMLQDDLGLFFQSMATTAILSSIATLVVSGPLSYGLAKVTLAQIEGEKWTIATLFDGFKERFVKSFLLGLLQSIFVALWSILFVIPGIVKGYSYALAFYIQRDNKDMEAVDCITESRRLMDGHKWQLFCLDLSFIGWYIVGALCLGIGVYFVTPYHEMARANFYEALMAENMTTGKAEEVIEEVKDEIE